MKLITGADHAGFELKEFLKKEFENQFEWKDVGTYSSDRVDYPDFAHPLAEAIAKGEYQKGILICGSGNGVAMTANKHANVRAALCWNVDIARLARQHNDANVLVLPARFISQEYACEIVKAFFETDFEGGRHINRVHKINI
ncbi:MAG: ribose 5-phosphate isomerase B [Bacteroidales bacterium]|nr:ribose 5-phosphate isomerase B [Bacteroidales bacterium]